MNLIRKGQGHAHRGVIGVEAAIVMIAFVIVAAALAFVVLNMGFSTTQKAKTSIISGLGEASSALEIAGKVVGSGDVAGAKLNVTAVPIKIASGGDSVNLEPANTAVMYLSNTISHDDIYQGTLTADADGARDTNGNWNSTENAVFDAVNTGGYCDDTPYGAGDSFPSDTCAFIFWSVNRNNNDILDRGEHAVLVIVYRDSERPSALDVIRAEVLLPTGASLTAERQVPNITNTVVDLG